MPALSIAAKNLMLEALPIAFLSLHTDYSTSGFNEVIGGSPPYARLPVTFFPASSGFKTVSDGPYIFDIPPTTVAWIGLFDIAGNFMGMSPNAGVSMFPFSGVGSTIQSASHPFLLDGTVVVWRGSATPLPTPLAEGTLYYVVTVTSTTLQLSATLGGPAISFNFEGNGFLQNISPFTNVSQTTFAVAQVVIDASVAA